MMALMLVALTATGAGHADAAAQLSAGPGGRQAPGRRRLRAAAAVLQPAAGPEPERPHRLLADALHARAAAGTRSAATRTSTRTSPASPPPRPRTASRARSRSAARTGSNWRVVAVNVVDSNQRSAVVVIGLPLDPVDSVMEHAALVVVGVGPADPGAGLLHRHLDRFPVLPAAGPGGEDCRRDRRGRPVPACGSRKSRPRRWAGLGSSLNAMLAHIESAFAARMASEARMRRFAADASHELRTPLVTIRGLLRAVPARRAGHPGRRGHRHGADRKRSQTDGSHGGGPAAAGQDRRAAAAAAETCRPAAAGQRRRGGHPGERPRAAPSP